ncbi:MAG: hypothetical protein CVT49_04175 [candidate division Zixibacteria bacterium HGW-Zixibacteria-1]|nr:MAG: hypothetical protein CVT49_04175 [candidate division Zixibacteria bacterium HGW-Zixibacteria-1]
MTELKKSDIVIVGGVAAGPKTAATLARRMPKAKITLFEKDRHISFGTCGLPYFASGDIDSFRELTVTSYGVPRDVDFFKKTKGFDVITGAKIINIDRSNKTVTVKEANDGVIYKYGFDKLVLATGATPQKTPFPIPESPKIRHFTRPEDAMEFRKAAQQGQIGKAVIIGGGFIGCELAEAVGGMWGIETVLVEKEVSLLPYLLDPEMAAIAQRELIRNNIEVRLSSCVEKIGLDDNGNPVIYIQNSAPIAADFVFLCLGVKPNVDLARDAGLEIGETGAIKINRNMLTSDPNIYAGGDCVESECLVSGRKLYIPMGSLANRHGHVIAENIAGNKTEFPGVTGAFLVKVFDTNIGSVGINEKTAEVCGLKARSVWGAFVDKPDYYPESKSFTLKMIYDENSDRLLGLQAVGSGDICRRIDVFSSFLLKKSKINDLLDFEQGYAPPYSEAIDPLYHLTTMAQAQQRGISFAKPGITIEKGNVLWLDVRETEEAAEDPWQLPEEIKKDHYINIPLNDLRDNLDKVKNFDKIRIVCRRGPRSYQAAIILRDAGYENVYISSGGTQAALA